MVFGRARRVVVRGAADRDTFLQPPLLPTVHLTYTHTSAMSACAESALTLVQSIPVGDFNIGLAPCARPTWEVLTNLAKSSKKSLDATAMYVDLLGLRDRELFSASQMKALGGDRGYELFDAMRTAAHRGVAIRLLLGTLQDPLNSTEVRTLLEFPNVQARQWDPTHWYGGGIMHAKVWVADARTAYIGSANSDWKSLAQVKELGLLLDGMHAAEGVDELASFFELFWRWASPTFSTSRVTAWSPTYQTTLTLPPWDPAVPAATRGRNPFASSRSLRSRFDIKSPFPLPGGASGFVSASPSGALAGVRVADEDALVYTLRDATTSACLSVMDFLPASAYSGGHGGAPVHWPALTDAMLAAVYAKPLKMRLLVSFWAHTEATQVAAMRRLADGLAACAAGYTACAGTLEVRQYFVPGWNATANATAGVWPSFSRVNHAKYIVTDRRLNVGTSNWQWGYFHDTVAIGASLNALGTCYPTLPLPACPWHDLT